MSSVGVPFEEADLDAALGAFEIKVIGAAVLLEAFLPGMRERRRGKLVCRRLAGRADPSPPSRSASTGFALEGMVPSLGFEVEPYGVRVDRGGRLRTRGAFPSNTRSIRR